MRRLVLVLLLLLGTIKGAWAGYASILIDGNTGHVLQESNADEINHPASLTKMMTLYLTFEALKNKKLKLGERIPVSAEAEAQAPSKLFLKEGMSVRVEDMVLALIIKSANDAAVVLAEHLGGSEEAFARQMTMKARALGMKNTVFKNASGLPDSAQITTAREIAILAKALIHNHPQYYHYFKTKNFTFQGQLYYTHNRILLNYKGADGLKTGFVAASRFNLAASAQRNGKRLIGVVLGGDTAAKRDRQMVRLLDAGFTGRHPKGKKIIIPEEREDVNEAALSVPTSQGSENSGGSWAIQVGAFHQKDTAHAVALDIKSKLSSYIGNIEAQAVPGKSQKKPVFRARLIGFDESDARRACKNILRSKECMVVPPGA